MPEFAYIARSGNGERIAGTLSAVSQRDAVAQLSGQELFPVEVTTAAQEKAQTKSRVRPQAVATMYAQLAGLLRSGVPLLKSIDVLRSQTSQPALVALLDDVYQQVEGGMTLADALARHPRVFSEMTSSILRAGGEGGFLEQALDHVAQYTEKQQDLKSRTLGALFYPVFLVVVGFVIINVLLIFFVPKFEPLFARLDELGELPVLTDALLWFSQGLQRWWLLIVAVLAVGVFMLQARLRTARGRFVLDRTMIRAPMIGSIFLHLAVARFCRVLGTLLSNGVPIVRSLEISSDAAGNRVLADAIRQAGDNLSAGQSLAGPLGACGYFPRDVVERIAVAEESNTLEQVLRDISESLDRQTWRRLDLLVRLIEPVTLLILAGVVLIVVIALLLPMMKLGMTV